MNLYMKMCYRTFHFTAPLSNGFHFKLIYPATRTSMMIQLRLPAPVLMFDYNEGLIYGSQFCEASD
jgi:hypothetical protein